MPEKSIESVPLAPAANAQSSPAGADRIVRRQLTGVLGLGKSLYERSPSVFKVC